MADFKLFGNEDPVVSQIATMTQGIGFPLRSVDTLSQEATMPATVLLAVDNTTQSPPGLDMPIQVTFGPAQNTINDPVMLDAAGVVTFNEGGSYQLLTRYTITRSSGGGIGRYFTRILVNGVQAQPPLGLAINNSDVSLSQIQIITTSALVPGDFLTLEFYRDSAGSNDGDLTTLTSTLGWGTSPSAGVRIIKLA